ncbi:unnamed protein product [Phytophthora fragariaefolia]|uniref:Unnamed protein product n=1 Tax=Phytophthora fragariaefolia TaxID=1490495 RepID=A0A9W7CVT4_9STRA|nr:unnamed protein product [Phytophthora fragariaefolia]
MGENDGVVESVPELPDGWGGPGNVVHWGRNTIAIEIEERHTDVATWLCLQTPHGCSSEETNNFTDRALRKGLLNFAESSDGHNLAEFCSRSEVVLAALKEGNLRLNTHFASSAMLHFANIGRLGLMRCIIHFFSPLIPPPPDRDQFGLADLLGRLHGCCLYSWTSCHSPVVIASLLGTVLF